MFCAQCGKENDDQGKFCQSCGAPLEPAKTELAPLPPPKSGQFNTDNKLFNFIAPFLAFIDSGEMFRKPFKWVYWIIAVLNLLAPLYQLYTTVKLIQSNLLSGATVPFLIAIWIVGAFAGWISFQIWWNRAKQLSEVTSAGEDFIVTPVFSHFIQTLGEWLGVYVGIVGCLNAIIIAAMPGDSGQLMGGGLGLGFLFGVQAIFLMPVLGFVIIVLSRFVAEQCRAIAAIANNTKKPSEQKEPD